MKKAKKKILIINSHFEIGGIETSMVNMANALCEYYDIDLFVYYPEGPTRERLDHRVNIIRPCFAIRAMGTSLSQIFKCGNPLIFLFKILGSLWAKLFDNRLPIWLATKIQPKMKGYDLAIAYRQEAAKTNLASGFVRVLDRCVESKSKAAWIHCDATKFINHQNFNRKYYKKIDRIIGVSKSVSEAFKSVNLEIADKVEYCYNFLDYDSILNQSLEKQEIVYNSNDFICFSAMRLAKEKAVIRAVSAIAPILTEYDDVKWYIAGDGPDRKAVEDAIKDANLADRIILLGNQTNPYPYMKNSDLMMLLSFHEAAPMVYMESHILGVPVFTTRTLSSDEMLEDGVNAFICENSEEGIRVAFADLMANREKVEKAKEGLKECQINNDKSMNKINELIELS